MAIKEFIVRELEDREEKGEARGKISWRGKRILGQAAHYIACVIIYTYPIDAVQTHKRPLVNYPNTLCAHIHLL